MIDEGVDKQSCKVGEGVATLPGRAVSSKCSAAFVDELLNEYGSNVSRQVNMPADVCHAGKYPSE